MGTHSADASALGFYFQTLFALEILVRETADNAAVAIEQLDDVELRADGQKLLYQLKHSISESPPPITLKSRALWKTIKVWIDILPNLSLFETTFHLVAVGAISDESPLNALLSFASDRAALVCDLIEEAKRVVNAHGAAIAAKTAAPYLDRIEGCKAFLNLTNTEQQNFVRRIIIKPNSPTIGEIEERISNCLLFLPVIQRMPVARRMVEWWDREVIYSLCGQRDRIISRAELQQKIMSIVGDLEEGKLVAEFEGAALPDDYQPNSMLIRQIELVRGGVSDITKAIREEWRAREQRSRWMSTNSAMASIINDYDRLLTEHWHDRHSQIVEDCVGSNDDKRCEVGLELLRWTHNDAPSLVRPIANDWSAHYYVRGSYQVLAINCTVGWHPNYAELLKDEI
jgi:hypothetical protein